MFTLAGVNLAGVKAFINFMVALFFPSLDVTLTYGLIKDAIEQLLHRRRTPLGRSTSVVFDRLLLILSGLD